MEDGHGYGLVDRMGGGSSPGGVRESFFESLAKLAGTVSMFSKKSTAGEIMDGLSSVYAGLLWMQSNGWCVVFPGSRRKAVV